MSAVLTKDITVSRSLGECRRQWRTVRWFYAPFMLLGVNGVGVWLATSGGYRLWLLVGVGLFALATSTVVERLIPYEANWNVPQGDGRRDVAHAVVNETIEIGAVIVLPSEVLPFMPLPVHRGYDMELPSLPVIAEAEACAEKLARYRRTALGRDVYDLAQMAIRPIDEPLVRRLWVLKVWGDVVEDRRGNGPLDPTDVLTERRERDFAAESIGMLTQPVDLAGWEHVVRQRFGFLAGLDEDERRWAGCDPRYRHEVEAALVAGGFPPS